jgi:hypothetical protein
MLGDTEMNDLTSPVPDHEPGVQKSESEADQDHASKWIASRAENPFGASGPRCWTLQRQESLSNPARSVTERPRRPGRRE